MMVRLLLMLLLVGCSDLSGRGGQADPAAYRHPRHRHARPVEKKKAPALAVEVEIEEEMGITRYLHRIDEETVEDLGAGLTGAIRVTLRNTSDHDLVLEDLGVQNLVFEKRYSREGYVIIHEGICSQMCRGDPKVVRYIELNPGESRSLHFRTWGYSNKSEMHPPAGRYTLGYRIREMATDRQLMPGCSSPSMTAAERVAICKRNLRSDDYWRGAFMGTKPNIHLAPTKHARELRY